MQARLTRTPTVLCAPCVAPLALAGMGDTVTCSSADVPHASVRGSVAEARAPHAAAACSRRNSPACSACCAVIGAAEGANMGGQLRGGKA